MQAQRFEFRFDRQWRLPLAAMGIRPSNSWVEVDEDTLDARFGPWRLTTPRSNVVGAEVTGPWRPHRAIGPRYSLADHGVTFGSSVVSTVLVTFHRAVPALMPTSVVRHPNATFSVAEPRALAELLDPTAAVS